MFYIDNNCQAFDIAIALYEWLSHWYGGKSCPKYSAMCMITCHYRLEHRGGLDEMTQMYYDDLTEDNWQDAYNEFCEYMDNEWDKEAC